MELLKAALLGAVAAFAVPMIFGGPTGVWGTSAAAWGTIAPLKGSPGLLFSLPIFIGLTLFAWTFFNWSNR
ncbi:MAG TPA: hypothetical protein VNT77_01915 [Allosphingosinicella sp.]|nr:hypothetical protein [Allosphingosinicella sp.]